MPCPNPAHAGSKVKRDGRYGPADHRRQAYKCSPTNGDPPHRFSEVLPREESWTGACPVCERPIETADGPQAPRNYWFVARGIAGALCDVGRGRTYTSTARIARSRAKRVPHHPRGQVSKHGQLVADWVEVFAPVVFEELGPKEWPATGTVVVDHAPFVVKGLNAKGKVVANKAAFDVFAAMGYRKNGTPKLLRLEAFPSATKANWMAFFNALPGQPQRIVCDNHSGTKAAIRSLWPTTEIYLCDWHIQVALMRLMDKIIRQKPRSRAVIEPLRDAVPARFYLTSWQHFVPQLRAANEPRIDAWLDEMDPIIRDQFRRAGPPGLRPPDMPVSTGGLEALLKQIEPVLKPRRYGLKNRERTNRLLMLLMLEHGGQASEVVYRSIIRDWLLANGGVPATTRRGIVDPLGSPSLRR